MALLDEQIDGKYEILEKIREGGMGAIYKVRHRLLDEVRVVKVIRTQTDPSSEASDRFLSEAKAAIRLRHPNIAVLHDFAVGGDGQAFIVMEMIDGWNLQEVLSGYGPPPLGMTLEIARQSLRALGYLHRHKIVHRDVSPDNLMVTRDVEGHLLVKLIDLGIAKNLEGNGGLTTTGVFLGKPRYGSPERFTGEGWDERSDLYSFGVVLYELLTGRCPVLGNEPAALMAGHLFRPPIPFEESDRGGRVPPELRALLLKALEKKPADRFAGADAFLSALAEIQARCPLDRGDVDTVWAVLQPIGAPHGASANPAGSTQFRLDQEFGVLQTPTRGIFASSPASPTLAEMPARGGRPGAEAPAGATEVVAALTAAETTRRTPAAPASEPGVVVPFPRSAEGGETVRTGGARPPSGPGDLAAVPDASQSVEPVDLDATWARRPLRKEPDPKAKVAARMEGAPVPAAGPLQGRSARTEPRRRFGLAVAGLLALAGLGAGGWWLGRERGAAAGGGSAERAAAAGPLEASPRPPGGAPGVDGPAGPVGEGAPGSVRPAPPLPAAVDLAAPAAEAKAPAAGAPPPASPVVPGRRRGGTSAEPMGPHFVPPMKLGDLITRGQPGVEEPEIRDLAVPVYPAAARASGRSATIRVQVLVDPAGKVVQSRIPHPDPSGLGFDDAAREAAGRTTFFPAKRDGVPGQMWTELDFELRDPQR